jgi:hypothetical protein
MIILELIPPWRRGSGGLNIITLFFPFCLLLGEMITSNHLINIVFYYKKQAINYLALKRGNCSMFLKYFVLFGQIFV